jgi:DNA-binding NtrC family response regulator
VGGARWVRVDVRVISATSRDLAAEIAAGRFREDLYYRLNVVEIRIPALRERLEDIPLLAEFFLQRITRKNGMARIRLTAEAVNLLQSHTWPGNVRELENTIARACALATSNILLPADIPLSSIPGKSPALLGNAIDQLINLAPTDDELLAWANREIAGRIVERADGDLKKAANSLNVSVSDLRDILKN